MSDRCFMLSKSIVNNIHKTAFHNFFQDKKIATKFTNNGQDIEYFISDMVNNGELSIEDLNEFLFEALFYGYHKDVFIWNICDEGSIVDDEKNLEEALLEEYGVSSLNYNRITHTFFNTTDIKEKLVAVKLYKTSEKVNKLRFIFAKEIKLISGKDDNKSEVQTHSYIPIEVNLDRQLIISKGYDKSYVIEKKDKYDSLIWHFTEKIKNTLDIETCIFGEDHSKATYSMCESLVEDVFAKILENKKDRLNDMIKELSEKVELEININDIEKKKLSNNIFNIEDNINKMIEHALVSDYFCYFKLSDSISDFIGLVTYIKFNDETNVKAVIKGQNSSTPVFDSDAFMGLRGSIKNAECLKELTIIWNNKGAPLRVKYDAGDLEVLKIHFYKKYSEGDFYYALDKYKEFESCLLESIQAMDRETAEIVDI